MKTSALGISFIKQWEGVRLKAYRDGGGVLTIGCGHTSAAGFPEVTAGLTITMKQSDEILARDLAKFEAGVAGAIRRAATQNQFDAMISLAFNIGIGAFGKSTVVRRFNEGNDKAAAEAFLLWNKDNGKVVKGLANRRLAERALFLTMPAQAPQKAQDAQPAPPAIPQPKLPEIAAGGLPASPEPGFYARLIKWLYG